jgi:hypothetical protein
VALLKLSPLSHPALVSGGGFLLRCLQPSLQQRSTWPSGDCLCCHTHVSADLEDRQARFEEVLDTHLAGLHPAAALLYFQDWLQEIVAYLLDDRVTVAWLTQCVARL